MINILYNIGVVVLLFISFSSFIIGLKYKRTHKELNHLFIYSISSFLQVLFIKSTKHLFSFPDKNAEHTAAKVSIYIFLVIEFSCIYLFFYKIRFYNKRIKKSLAFTFGFCLLSYIILAIKSNFFILHVDYIYYIQSLIILVPCFLYLYQLFVQPPTLNLLNEASFWFFSGILIYFILTLPLFFMIHYFQSKIMRVMVDIINLLGYNLIFSFLIRAYLCKPKTTI